MNEPKGPKKPYGASGMAAGLFLVALVSLVIYLVLRYVVLVH